MEDSTAMTIEFLRARLLSERSVSRSARQRADELAKRVAELEEQLKFVSHQRKMAEKATADVLAILEDNGVSDVSETLDSNSDEETLRKSKVGDDYAKEDLSSVNSKVRKNDTWDLSGSDLDTSPVLGGSLSWKGRKDTSRSLEKYNVSSMRRQRSISSVSSASPRQHLGRSCRQVKRKETRLLDEELKSEVHSQEHVVAFSSEGSPNCSNGGSKISREVSEIQEEKVLLDNSLLGSSQSHTSAANNDLDLSVEKALERQAELIDRYEAMEKAQREWEEKFQENNSSTPDSCDHGNHSDVTEETEDIRARAQKPSDIASPSEVAKSEAKDIDIHGESSRAQLNGFQRPSCVDTGDFHDKHDKNAPPTQSSAEEFAFPTAKAKQTKESCKNRCHQPSHSSDRNHGTHDNISDASSNISKPDISGSRNDLYALVPHEKPELGNVLEALKQAKLSLIKKINNKSPSVEDQTGSNGIEEASNSAPRIAGRVDIPIGYTGLFRLPTDYLVEASTQPNFLISGSQLRSPDYYHDERSNQIVTSRFMDPVSSFPRDDLFLGNPYMEMASNFSRDDRVQSNRFQDMGWRSPNSKPQFDIPSSGMFNTRSSLPDLSRIPPNEEFSRTFTGREAGIHPSDVFSFHGDQNRPNMYR